MRRIIMLAAAAAVALVLSACGDNAPKQPEGAAEVSAEQPAAATEAAPAVDESAAAGAADAQMQE